MRAGAAGALLAVAVGSPGCAPRGAPAPVAVVPPVARGDVTGTPVPGEDALPLPARQIAPGVYVVPGDTGRGSEGRANAGFIVTDSGLVAIDAGGSPLEGTRLLRAMHAVTMRPLRWLILTHHHPDHHFGAIALRRAGARVLAHPDRTMLAAEGGDDDLVASWYGVVGVHAMTGFEFADTPDVPITRDTTVRVGDRTLVVLHPGPAHSPADLMVWLPETRVLFAGDVLVEDGVTMMVDGSSSALLDALAEIDSLGPRVVVPGHGRLPPDPRALTARTRAYVDSLRGAARSALERGMPMSRFLATSPPADASRPVSRASRGQRNAVRVYREMERSVMGLGAETAAALARPRGDGGDDAQVARRRRPRGTGTSLVSTAELAALLRADSSRLTLLDVRTDVAAYLRSHLGGATYLNPETLRASERGIPNLLLPAANYAALFARLGVRRDRPVVVYSAGEARNFEATYAAWILSAAGVADVRVLDGGFAKWEGEGRAVARHYPRTSSSTWAAEPFTPERASLDEVRRALGTPGTVLVDARIPEQYTGAAGAQMRRGHIPGALNHYWQDDLTPDGLSHVWKARQALAASYAAQGVTPSADIIVYCNGGLESSHVWFTLRRVLGYPRVRVYDGSFTEWAERDDLPVETGAGPPDPRRD